MKRVSVHLLKILAMLNNSLILKANAPLNSPPWTEEWERNWTMSHSEAFCMAHYHPNKHRMRLRILCIPGVVRNRLTLKDRFMHLTVVKGGVEGAMWEPSMGTSHMLRTSITDPLSSYFLLHFLPFSAIFSPFLSASPLRCNICGKHR
jgi:hypothetical protein